MTDVLRGKTIVCRVVGPPNHDDMNECHSTEQRYHAQGHDLVLTEEPLGTDVASTDADQDDGQAKPRAPP